MVPLFAWQKFQEMPETFDRVMNGRVRIGLTLKRLAVASPQKEIHLFVIKFAIQITCFLVHPFQCDLCKPASMSEKLTGTE